MGIENIINELKNNPMFRLSLGSKELFHSNFLEFLWEYDDDKNHRKFFDMLRELGCERDWKDRVEYILSREKENFDICIYHKGSGGKIWYDLIIENKVKSIPRKEQLMEYYKKTEGHSSEKMKLILLSLVVNFPDRSIIEGEEFRKKHGYWKIVNYDSLSSAIRKAYNNTDNGNYINDYCKFIDQMHLLQNEILGNDFEKEPYYKRDELDQLKDVRLQDLYIKLRASRFLSLLESNLIGISNVFVMPCDGYLKYDDIRDENKNEETRIVLNYTIQRGNGMVAAFIYKKGNWDKKIFEVVIQGDEYRHGVNSPKYKSSNDDKDKKLVNLWNDVSKFDYMNQIDEKSKFIDKYKNKYKSFRVYGDDYVYRYLKIESKTVKELIEMMKKDIRYVVDNKDLW